MKHIIFLCLFATFIVSCSSSQKPAPENEGIVDTNVRADHDDNLSDLITDIQDHLPMTIENKWLQLKNVELDESKKVLTFFIFNNENIKGDWWDDDYGDKYWGKFIVAQLVAMPEFLGNLSSKDLEEIKEDKDFQEIYENLPHYKKVNTLLKSVSKLGYNIRLKFHSRDNYTNIVDLNPEEIQDAVVFYNEILEKVSKDHTIENPF